MAAELNFWLRRGSGIETLFEKQKEILAYIFSNIDDPLTIKIIHLCCGIGFSKTTIAILAAQVALERGSWERGLFLEPDVPSLDDTFLEEWEKLVPLNRYRLLYGRRRIIWHNGAVLYFGPRVVTGSRARSADKYRGRNLTFVIDDETAIEFNMELFQNVLGRIRIKGVPNKFYFTASTPKIGPYGDLIQTPGHRLFTGRTADNTELDPTFEPRMRAAMSPDQAERELDGKLIALEGRVWKYAEYKRLHPDGNLHPKKFDPNKPFGVACDIGNRGAWLLWQWENNHGMNYTATMPTKRDSVIAFAEYTPNDGNVDKMITRIEADYGTPNRVILGYDLNTNSILRDENAVTIFTSRGWLNVTCPPRHMFGKSNQFTAANRTLLLSNKLRLFTISSDFKSHDDVYPKRGIRELWDQDVWGDTVGNEFLPTNKNKYPYVDMRDAWEYLCATLFPLQDHRQKGGQ